MSRPMRQRRPQASAKASNQQAHTAHPLPKHLRDSERPLVGTVPWPTLRDGTACHPGIMLPVHLKGVAEPGRPATLLSFHWAPDLHAWVGDLTVLGETDHVAAYLHDLEKRS